MHAVGDRPDVIAREHSVGGQGMARRHAIDEARQIEGQPCHVERIVTGQQPDLIDVDVITQDMAEQAVVESVVASLDRCVRGEDAGVVDRRDAELQAG